MSRITLQMVAQRSGVSAATASHALNGSGRVAGATRLRVREAAEALGYRPDPMLSALVTYRRGRRTRQAPANLAFLLYPRNAGEWSPKAPAWRVFEAAREAAHQLGYALETFDLNAHARLGAAVRILRDRGVRGVIFPSHRNREDLLDFPLEHFAAVEVGYTHVLHKEIDRVTMNDFAALRLVWRQLLARGYRRIGLVMDPSTSLNSGDAWMAAYLLEQAQAAANLGLPPLPVHRLSDSVPKHELRFADWFREHQLDAVISRKSLRRVFNALALNIPRDLGYANLGVQEAGASASGTLFDVREMGRNAVAMLDHSLRHGRLGLPEVARTVLLQPRWNEGSSLRPLPGDSSNPANSTLPNILT